MSCGKCGKGCDDMPGDENVQRIHEKMLNDNAQAISKFSEGFARLERQFDGLNSWMKGIAKEIKDFVEKTDSKYQTKEMCEMCALTGEKQYVELVKVYELRIAEIKANHKEEMKKQKEEAEKSLADFKTSIDKRFDAIINRLWWIAGGAATAFGTLFWYLLKTHILDVIK